jgi:hypothetical protein
MFSIESRYQRQALICSSSVPNQFGRCCRWLRTRELLSHRLQVYDCRRRQAHFDRSPSSGSQFLNYDSMIFLLSISPRRLFYVVFESFAVFTTSTALSTRVDCLSLVARNESPEATSSEIPSRDCKAIVMTQKAPLDSLDDVTINSN